MDCGLQRSEPIFLLLQLLSYPKPLRKVKSSVKPALNPLTRRAYESSQPQFLAGNIVLMGDNMHMEVQEDEEEDDLDFNPLLRGETLSEASSSLSSEDEAVSVYRQSRLEHGPLKSRSSVEPLFSLPMAVSLDNAGSNFVGGSVPV
ncbi:uncharacterized protein LOC110025012 [Phalaenopsis equestris]|uniref:uncharacterized protein LOC110025012 n=1 Tax=Phalaenopsis equestris TaxID=78828 RepID=UPI0009E257A5|nr:uncharacterized protein LOC110025012 [Phalaenopsis equestris]